MVANCRFVTLVVKLSGMWHSWKADPVSSAETQFFSPQPLLVPVQLLRVIIVFRVKRGHFAVHRIIVAQCDRIALDGTEMRNIVPLRPV